MVLFKKGVCPVADFIRDVAAHFAQFYLSVMSFDMRAALARLARIAGSFEQVIPRYAFGIVIAIAGKLLRPQSLFGVQRPISPPPLSAHQLPATIDAYDRIVRSVNDQCWNVDARQNSRNIDHLVHSH